MMKKRKKIKVAVICGGPSSERQVSLKSAVQVLRNIPKSKYKAVLLEIKKDGQWILNKKTKLVLSAREVKNKFAVAFLVTHGQFGEDGKLQAIMEMLGIPYTGSGVLVSALCMNKIKTKQLLSLMGVNMPKGVIIGKTLLRRQDASLLVQKSVKYPCVVKPNESGSSIGVAIVHNSRQLAAALKDGFKEDKTLLVEEYIAGREITCGVLGNSIPVSETPAFRLLALPPVEIIPKTKFFDYRAKYQPGMSQEICPAGIGKILNNKIQMLSKKIHQFLGCDGLTRSDFIITKQGKIYFLEINTIPGLTEQSLCPKEAHAAGIPFSKFLDMQIELAMEKNK